MKQPEVLRNLGKDVFRVGGAFILLFIFLAFFYFPSGSGTFYRDRISSAQQYAHAIGLALYSYAKDHEGRYPEGNSSTEVFQKLIDGGYVIDASVFYRDVPGKIPAVGKHLKPENVCFDVTCCIDSSSPPDTPAIFLTGYKITYQAGAAAEPLTPFHGRSWSQWFSHDVSWRPSIAVYYVNNSSQDMKAADDGNIPNFIPADFDAKGKTYRQLTP